MMGLSTGFASWTRRVLRRSLGRLRRHGSATDGPVRRARAWLRTHETPSGGILIHSQHRDAYPEVSGYLVPTLLEHGERGLARAVLGWLVTIQRGDGAYPGPDGKPFVFDTGQVLRGLLAELDLVAGALDAGRRAADWLCGQMVGDGGFGPRYSDEIPEPIHLYVLPPLRQAADLFGEPRYHTAVERCFAHYRRHPRFLRTDDLTHFLAYELEALIDLGHPELAKPALDTLAAVQRPDGAVRARGGVDWVCTPGLAQLAICWYKTGHRVPADRALGWLEAHQEPSGGFFGSYGRGASYFPDVEPAWAVKYFLDAQTWRGRAGPPGTSKGGRC